MHGRGPHPAPREAGPHSATFELRGLGSRAGGVSAYVRAPSAADLWKPEGVVVAGGGLVSEGGGWWTELCRTAQRLFSARLQRYLEERHGDSAGIGVWVSGCEEDGQGRRGIGQ